MRKAFIILAHQMPEQLNILLRQLLHDPENEIFIHVNKLSEDIIPGIMRDGRVHISPNNIKIHWGSDEILQATLNMFREVTDYPAAFEYVMVISGQDLLVRQGLDEFLTEHNGRVFIDARTSSETRSADFFDRYTRARVLYKWPEIYRRRYDFRLHPVRLLRTVRFRMFFRGVPFGRKKTDYPTDGMRFTKDYYWCALPRRVVEYILRFIGENPGYLSIYKDAFQPEEGFIATLILNSDYPDEEVFVNGECRSLTYTNTIENNHAPVLKTEDIKAIEASGRFFARKFDQRVDAKVIEYFRDKILGESEGDA